LKANLHFTFSRDTVWALIGVCVVARVFARSWFDAGHAPALAAHSGGGWPTAADAGPAVAPRAGRRAQGRRRGRGRDGGERRRAR
jgi:hypothetical protein